jgi:hypothetical protein
MDENTRKQHGMRITQKKEGEKVSANAPCLCSILRRFRLAMIMQFSQKKKLRLTYESEAQINSVEFVGMR